MEYCIKENITKEMSLYIWLGVEEWKEHCFKKWYWTSAEPEVETQVCIQNQMLGMHIFYKCWTWVTTWQMKKKYVELCTWVHIYSKSYGWLIVNTFI